MSNPPEYKEALAYPTAPPTEQSGHYGVTAAYPPYPPPGTAQYPTYPVPPAEPQPLPPYPPYGVPVAAPATTAYGQDRGIPYEPTATVGYSGGYGDSEQGRVDDTTAMWNSNSISDKKIRQQFIKKVYLILMSQLFFTFGVVCLFFFCFTVKNWVIRNTWFYWCSYAVFVVTYITLVCCENVRRRWPANIICLFIFTAALSYMAGTITSFYDTQSVLIAMGMTAAVCLGISLFAIQTKIDFTLCSGLIFVLCLVLTLFGFSCMITFLIHGSNYILQTVYGGLAAVVFSLFLVFDTHSIIGGSQLRYLVSPEEHINGALQLYVDVVYLFIILLGLVGRKK